MIKITGAFFLCLTVIAFTSCSTQNDDENKQTHNNNPPATVFFVNESSYYKIDIYKNLNPDYFDPTTLVCTVNPGSTKKEQLYASTDQKIGDTFYPRYKVLLANSRDTGTSDIYIDAQRNLSNISFVVESGKTYTKTIPEPVAGELKFINGYIAIQNLTTTQVQILKAGEVQPKLDDHGAFLNPGQNLGYYEISLSSFSDTLTVNQLQAFSSSYVNFPEFVMERGKLYSFIINNTNVIDSPSIKNIDLLRN
jgi:hypothetical protein